MNWGTSAERKFSFVLHSYSFQIVQIQYTVLSTNSTFIFKITLYSAWSDFGTDTPRYGNPEGA